MLGIGGQEAVALLIIGLLVLGPERLPRYAADVGRFIRTVRRMVDQARDEVRSTLEPELRDMGLDREDLRSWFGEDEPTPRRPASTGPAPRYPDAT